MASKTGITYDYSSMMSENIGKHGETNAHFMKLRDRLSGVKNTLKQAGSEDGAGFMAVPDRMSGAKKAEELAKEISSRFSALIVIGIGGSDLGAKAIIHALKAPDKGMDVHFIGSNTDPTEIGHLLDQVDLKRCALNVISKSGETIEPMSTFLILREKLIGRVGEKPHAEHVIVTTDNGSGTLRKIAGREGYRILPIPDDIGGRFSAFTPVGLFPAACAGISAKRLLAGAEKVLDDFFGTEVKHNGPLMFAGLHFDGLERRGQDIAVLMPYSSELKDLSLWWRQLWAESLGKRADRKGKVVNSGQTPVAALGATDQHSQLQLYNAGPADKLITFIENKKFRVDFKVPDPYPDLEGVSYMAGIKMSRINHTEREATAYSLAKEGRPNGTVYIPDISPGSVGGLMMFFMLSTAVMAELMDVNAYDQPGVESMKKTMSALLGRKGYKL